MAVILSFCNLAPFQSHMDGQLTNLGVRKQTHIILQKYYNAILEPKQDEIWLAFCLQKYWNKVSGVQGFGERKCRHHFAHTHTRPVSAVSIHWPSDGQQNTSRTLKAYSADTKCSHNVTGTVGQCYKHCHNNGDNIENIFLRWPGSASAHLQQKHWQAGGINTLGQNK